HGCGPGSAREYLAKPGHVRVVVVVDPVVLEDRAAGGAVNWRRGPGGATAILRRRLVIIVLGVRGQPGLVLVKLRVGDDQIAAGVGAGKAQRAVLATTVLKNLRAVRTGADVEGRVAHVVGVA